MFTSSFSVLSKSQEAYIKLDNIRANYDGLRSSLDIFISFKLRTPVNENPFDVNNISARLKLAVPSYLLSLTHIISATSVNDNEYDTGEWFSFILDDKALHAIEKNRDGDVKLIIELTLGLTVKTEFKVGNQFIRGVRHSENQNTSIHFIIPRSIWVEQLLPKLGYQNLKLIEIPLDHRSLKEAYDDIILEFNRGEHYFNLKDYNKCVAHCRHTLDALTRNLRKVKDETPSETAFKWLENVDKATFTWIDEVNKSNQAIMSKTHHSGQTRDFTRIEAESIYLVTLGLLNFIGHLK